MLHANAATVTSHWRAYLTGAVLVFALKVVNYQVRYYRNLLPSKKKKPWFWQGILEFGWPKEKKSVKGGASSISWVTTIGIVWVLGGVVAHNMDMFLPEALHNLAVHRATAFLFGTLAEMIAPKLANTLVDNVVRVFKL